MTHDEQRKVVIDSDGEQKEYVHTETNYIPNETHYVPVVREQSGISGASVALIVIASVAVVSLFFILIMNNQRDEYEANANREVIVKQEPAQPQQPIVVQQPVQQPPVVVQQPASSSQPPVVIGGSTGSNSSVEVDMKLQTEIDKRLEDDSTFSLYDITATVLDGKVTLIGTVDSEEMKTKIEKMVRNIKGVKNIDNQILISTM